MSEVTKIRELEQQVSSNIANIKLIVDILEVIDLNTFSFSSSHRILFY